MAGKTIAFTDKVLNMLAAGSFPSVTDVPATTFVGLLHTSPTVDDMTSAVETTYTSYARQSIVSTSTGWNAPANGSGSTRTISNKLLLTFVTAGATGDTGINSFAVCKTLSTAITTAGEAIYWGAITGAPKVINSGDPVSMAISALVITED